MQCLIEIYAVLIGATLYRIRGGWHLIPLQGAQTVRILWSVATGALVWGLAGGPWWLWPLTALGTFLGLLIPQGWGTSWPAADPSSTRLPKALGMAALGVVRLALIVAPVAATAVPGLWWAMAAGPLMAVAYGVSVWLPVPKDLPPPPPPHFLGPPVPLDPSPEYLNPINNETAWAELMWGGLQWGILACMAGG